MSDFGCEDLTASLTHRSRRLEPAADIWAILTDEGRKLGVVLACPWLCLAAASRLRSLEPSEGEGLVFGAEHGVGEGERGSVG